MIELRFGLRDVPPLPQLGLLPAKRIVHDIFGMLENADVALVIFDFVDPGFQLGLLPDDEA